MKKGKKIGKNDYIIKDDPSYVKIQELADSKNITMEQLFSNPEYDEDVVKVLHQFTPSVGPIKIPASVLLKGYKASRFKFLEKFTQMEKK